jgi:branched-chain amino acid transport system substrate-binding protein
MIRRRSVLAGLSAVAIVGAAPVASAQQQTIKIGMPMALTGVLAAVGQQAVNGAKLYVQLHGDSVAGKKIELIIRDDGSVPDNSRRIAQEMIVNDKVAVVTAGLTPNALAIAPVLTQSKTPGVIMVSGTSVVTEKSPYYVRTSWTLGQQSLAMAQWAAKNGSKRVAVIQSDWAPGDEAANVFIDVFKKAGGEIVSTSKVPLQNPDFSAYLQRAVDAKPDTLFVFVPAGQAGVFARQFVERGLAKDGIKLIGSGDITDDQDLPTMGDAMIGTVTAGFHSVTHKSAENKKFVEEYRKAYPNLKPNFVAVAGYDGMHAIYEALKKTNGDTDGDKIMAALKGLQWESPRGPAMIDPETRDIVHNIYIRRVEKIDGTLYNTEFETVPMVKDPSHKPAS